MLEAELAISLLDQYVNAICMNFVLFESTALHYEAVFFYSKEKKESKGSPDNSYKSV